MKINVCAVQSADGSVERFVLKMVAESHAEALELHKYVDLIERSMDEHKQKVSHDYDSLIDDPFGDGR